MPIGRTQFYRGIVTELVASQSGVRVELIDIGAETLVAESAILDHTDPAMVEVNPMMMKLAVMHYETMDEKGKAVCHKSLEKFMKKAIHLDLEAHIDCTDPNQLKLIELSGYVFDGDTKVPLRRFTAKEQPKMTKSDSHIMRIPLEFAENTYLTINMTTKTVIDLIPLESPVNWIPHKFPPPSMSTSNVICRHIDDQGGIYVCNLTEKQPLQTIEDEIKKYFTAAQFHSDEMDFMVGDAVIVFRPEIDAYCRGVITEMNLDTYTVHLIDHGNSIDCTHVQLSSTIVTVHIPCFVGKFTLSDMSEKKWSLKELQKLNHLIHDKLINITVTGENKNVVECTVSNIQLANGTSVENLKFCFQNDARENNSLPKFNMSSKCALMNINEQEEFVNSFLYQDKLSRLITSVVSDDSGSKKSSSDEHSYKDIEDALIYNRLQRRDKKEWNKTTNLRFG